MNGSVESCRRERKDVQRNLERVLQAAHTLFAERGSDVTMEEVARQAGVGVGTIYRRFPSKEHLWAAVSQAVCLDAQQCLRQATEQQPDPVGKLRALIVVQYRRSQQQAALLETPAAGVGSSQPDGGFDQQQLRQVLHTMLRQFIAEGQRQGTIRQGSPDVLASLCLELLNPRTFLRLQQTVGGSADECAEHAAQFVVAALAAPA